MREPRFSDRGRDDGRAAERAGGADAQRDRDGEDLRAQRRRAEAAKQSLPLIPETIREVFYVQDLRDGRIDYISPGYEDVWGRSLESLYEAPMSYLDAVLAEDRAVAAELLEAAARGQAREAEYRIRRPDGEVRWILDRSFPVRDESGVVSRLVGVAEDITDRKRVEAERERLLAELESQRTIFDAVLAQLPVGVTVAEAPSGRILYFNREAERVLGHPMIAVDGYTGYARYGAVHEDGTRYAPGEHPLARALHGEEIRGEEVRYRRAGVEIRLLSVAAVPVVDADGTRIAAVSVFVDVTEQRKAEYRQALLSEASARFAASVDYRETLREVARTAVPDVADYVLVDLVEDGRIRRVEAAHRKAGSEPHIRELLRHPPAAEELTGVALALRTGEPLLVSELTDEMLRTWATDPALLRAARALEPLSVVIAPLIARGRMLGALTFVTSRDSGRRYGDEDVAFAQELARRAALALDNARLLAEAQDARGEAERRAREEAALREATGALSASFTVEEVVRQIADKALVATNADGAFVERIDVESGAVVVVAVAGRRTPPIGSSVPYAGSFTQLIVERNEPVALERLERKVSELPLPDHLIRECADCAAAFIPLVDIGEPIGTLVLLRTPEKRGFRPDEVQRALTFGDLAALAFRKVHILEESELRREELEQVSESRARLMRGFSHDVKNPLGAADGTLDLLETGVRGQLEPEQLHDLRRARRSIHAALRLIEDLLEYARAEAEQIEIRPSPTDVREAAAEIAEEHRAQAEAKGISLRLYIPAAFPVIASDADRVRQILGNLLSNAAKFTPAGGRIEVRAAVRQNGDAPGRQSGGAPGPRRWITIAVSDTGRGIPPDQLHLLFQEFARLETPEGQRGAGVGLAISRRVARILGGDITVDSEPGVGSTFTLWLPADEVGAGAARTGPSGAAEPPAPRSRRPSDQGTAADGGRAAASRRPPSAPLTWWPSFVDHLEDYGVFLLDLSGRIVHWSRGAERITGYAASDAIGRPLSALYSPEEAERGAAEQEMRIALETGRHEAEHWRRRADGEPFYESEILVPIRNEAGEHVGFGKVFRDLTAQRRADEMLRARAREQAAVARLGQLALAGIGLDTLFDEAVRCLHESLRPDFTEILELRPGHDALRLRAGVGWTPGAVGTAQVSAGRESQAGYTLLSREPIIVEDLRTETRFRGPPLLTEHGAISGMTVIIGTPERPWGVLGTHTHSPRRFTTDDIHFLQAVANVLATGIDRMRTEHQRRFLAEAGQVLASSLDLEETLRRIARLVVPGMADWCAVDIVDAERIRRVAIAHVDPAKVAVAWDITRRWPTDRHAPAGIAKALRTGEPQLVTRISDSALRDVTLDEEHFRQLRELGLRSVMIVPMQARGRTLGVISFVAAESGRLYDPADLAHAEALSSRAAIAVDNARLYEEAERASRAKSDFLAVMSHELRTPLTAVIGFSEILETGIDGPVTDAQRMRLGRIRASAGHLVHLIEEILTFSRLDSGREEVRAGPIDLAALARETADVVQPAAKAKHLQFRARIPDRPVPAETDAEKVRRILLNLLTNAVTFTREGRVEFTMQPAENEVVFRIRDTGIGIAPKDIQHIFEPFWQAAAALTREVGGTGLGLTLALRLARMLGGDITVESQVGAGSTFTLHLPTRTPTPTPGPGFPLYF